MKLVESNIKARPVSRGLGFGKVLVIHGNKNKFYKINISQNDLSSELKRFESALNSSVKQIDRLIRSKQKLPKSASAIFESHKMILSDKGLKEKIESEISTNLVNAEWAVKSIFEEYISQFKSIINKHIRQKYIDLDDVSDRLLNSLKPPKRKRSFPAGTILVVKELTPSMLIDLSKNDVSGIISERGGWTSHSFILARELNIPAVTGIRKALQRFNDGDPVFIDAYKGVVTLNPNAKKISTANVTSSKKDPISNLAVNSMPTTATKTIDGRKINIKCNADKFTNYQEASNLGAKGIGLYRSELLINENGRLPSENTQYKLYSKAAKETGDHGVNIRIYDIGPETLNDLYTESEKNPALGLRAIRFAFANPEYYKKQIRALLRASAHGKIDIILPMVSGLEEIRMFKSVLENERTLLSRKEIKIGAPQIGVMIEVPSAVLMIDEILNEVDTVCLGTNDLVQYLTAVDRDNELVSDWFQTLHPANIRAVKSVITASRKHNKPVVICGEMAGSVYYVPLLIGLGATELSMNINSVARVRQLINGIAYDEAAALANNISQMDTAAEINSALRTEIINKWHHLYDDSMII